MKLNKGSLIFIAATLALAGVFFVAATLAGRAMVISGHVYHNNALFGVDTARNMAIMTEPGLHSQADLERSHVHPFFTPLIKPWAPLVMKLGLTPGVSAMVVCAAAGACALVLAAWYFRRRRLARPDAWLLAFLMGASSTWVCMSAIPGSYIFSLNFIILSFILAHWTLERPAAALAPPARWAREAAWLAVGVLNYGITITNGFISFLAYGFSRRGRAGWMRAVIYGAVVVAVGMAIAYASGSLLNFWDESQWARNPVLRGGTPRFMTAIVIVTPLLWSFIAPWPTLNWLGSPREPISGILHWNYTGLDWLLAALCAALLLAGAWAALKDRDPVSRRVSAGLAAALGFHVLLHRFYYHAFEGVFFFTPHSIFLVVGLLGPLLACAPRWPAGARLAVRISLCLLAVALAARNYNYFFMLRTIIPLH